MNEKRSGLMRGLGWVVGFAQGGLPRREIVVVVVTCVQRTESPRDKLKRLPFGTVNRTGGGEEFLIWFNVYYVV